MSPCWLIMISHCGLPCRLAFRFVTLWHWSLRSVHNLNHCLMRCGCCWAFWVLFVFMALPPLTPPYLISLLPHCPRAWYISRMSWLHTPHTPAISGGSFICPTYQLTLGIQINVRCWRLLWFLQILFFGRKISINFSILPALHLPYVPTGHGRHGIQALLRFLDSPLPL